MMNSLKSHKDKMKKNQEKGRRLKIVTLLCSLFVVGAVLWGLILPGIAMTGKTYCGLEEHTHSEDCYTTELTCGQEESEDHTHTDACYSQVLTCGKEEHTHTEACESNPEADLETAETWEASIKDSGYEEGQNWNQKITAIAESQLGYSESKDNFCLGDDNSHKGYTRYGAWATATKDYGTWTAEDMTYSDWDTLLAAFALNYAGVDKNIFPVYSDANVWMNALKDAGLFGDASSNYQAGDLVFFNRSGDQETLFQVGIIDIVGSGDDGAKTTITVIQGNDENSVKETSYQVTDSQILGYGLVSQAWEKSRGTANTENTDPAEDTSDGENVEDTGNAGNANDAGNVENGNEPAEAAVANDKVDQGVTFDISSDPSSGENGQTLQISVNSTNSHPSDTTTPEEMKLDIGVLPDGVSLAGFDENGKLKVHYGDETTGGNITVELHKNPDGTSYIIYKQPAGSTIQFVLQFNSENGIMDKKNTVTITPSIKNKQPNDYVKVNGTDITEQGAAQYLTLTWTGENKWDNLQKTVDKTKIEINDDNQLVGNLEYKISAQEFNKDVNGDTGSIWTKTVVLKDTLSLPDGMTFPEGARVSGDKVVDKNGNVLFTFDFTSLTKSKHQSVSVNEVTIANDRRSISYKITLTNTNTDDEGKYIGEMDSISDLKATLDASKLVLDDSYKTMSEQDLAAKKITNTVSIDTTAIKGNDSYEHEETVHTTPAKTENYSITKTANQNNKNVGGQSVKPGSTIDYTITVKNDGSITLPEKDAYGNYYTITDTLPKQLTLTDAQKKAIENKGGTVTTAQDGTCTISFPQENSIAPGGTLEFTFKADVKSEKELTKSDLGTSIKNKAEYRGKTGEVTVNVEKTEIKLNKTVDKKDDVKNGDTLTYTITVENPNNTPVDFDQILSDTLDKHLEFMGMYDSNGKNLTVGSDVEYDAESTAPSGKHSVTFTNTTGTDKRTNLQWKVGTLAAHEKVTIIYKAKVNLNDGESVTNINNKVTSNHGEEGTTDSKVTPPTTVDKKVKESSDEKYGDGGGSYDNGTTLDYKISISNAKGDEASTYKHHLLTDTLDAGLLLKYDGVLYTADENAFKTGQLTPTNGLTATTLTLDDFINKSKSGNNDEKYYIIINNEVVQVAKSWSEEKKDTWKTILTWYIGELKAGTTVEKTYQATLKMSDKDDSKTAYSNKVESGGSEKTVTVYGKKEGAGGYADIKKNVWTIAKFNQDSDQIFYNNNQLNNKKYFSIDDNKHNYVLYTITIANTGTDKITVNTITDEYGDNLEYKGIIPHIWKGDYSDQITVQNYNWCSWLDVEGNDSVGGFKIKCTKNDTTTHTATYQVGDADKGVTLEAGKTFSFFVLCKVKDPKLDNSITNTAKLYVDKDVQYKDYGTIKTKGTKDDGYQNNGSSKDEGVTGNQRVISSSVSVVPTNSIIPGITKEAKGYISAGKKIKDMQEITAENKKTNIHPQSTVKWEITLYNDGTQPIKGYTISDSVEKPFHILTRNEATGLGITADNKAQNKVFLLEIYDSVSSTSPTKTKDLSSDVWNIVTKDSNSFSVEVSDNDYQIPAGGYAKFTVYTKCDTQNFKIYENTATFTPKEDFDGTKVETGQVVTDENGNVTGVKASDSVYAMGDYGSFSWKTITEKSNDKNQAVGYASNNYIKIDSENSKTVVYTNNINNVSQKKFTNLTILDLMPFSGDTGVLNQSQKRGSEFTVAYKGGLSITLKDAKGKEIKTLTEGIDYTIQFSDKVSFTTADTEHGNSDGWHDTWQTKDKSFRILMSDNFTLDSTQILTIQYEGQISGDAQPGQIAWNSFGYAYNAEGYTDSRLSAEPPKVGVKIPNSPTISKKVVDSEGKDQGYNGSKTFTFKVYEGNKVNESKLKGSFTLHQGEAKKIASIKDANGNPIFTSGQTYTLVEEQASGYSLKSIQSSDDKKAIEENKYTFNYQSSKENYSIIFTNKPDSYELPGTGGIGIKPFLISGAALMCLAILLFGYNLKRKRR